MVSKFKEGSGMAIYAVLILLAVALLNAMSARHYKKIDLTEDGMFTLSPQSVKVLKSLEESVTVYAFVRETGEVEARDFLNKYAYESDKFKFEIIDPDKNPAMSEKYSVTDYDTFVVETASGRKESARNMNEDGITNAIIKAMTTKQKTIFMVEGHGERNMNDQKPQGWAGVKAALDSAMYNVKTLNFFSKGEIPEETDLLIIAGPRNDFQRGEIEALHKYLDKGGKLLLALDPIKLPELERSFSDYGIAFDENFILDFLSQRVGFSPTVAAVSSYPKHPIVQDITAATFFPGARSLSIAFGNKKKANIKPFGLTSDKSWGETDLKSIEEANAGYNEPEDKKGPLFLAVSVQLEVGKDKTDRKIGEKAEEVRIVAIGDSDFTSNSMLGLSSNKDLFLNMVAWLVEEEFRVSIRPKTRGFNPIIFTSTELTVIFWLVVVAIPVAVIVIGAVVRVRRRRE